MKRFLSFKNIVLFILSSLVFLGFVFFSFLVHKNLFTQFDFDSTVRLQNHISHKWDLPFSFLSLIGSAEVVSVVLIAILLIRRKLSGIFVLFLFGFFHLFEIYGKAFVTHPGPPFFLYRYTLPFVLPSSYVQPGSSYPSGHAARAFFITIIFGILIQKSKKIDLWQKVALYGLLFLYDLAMVTSRVYLGEHWTTDVIGGSILGIAFGILSGIVLL